MSVCKGYMHYEYLLTVFMSLMLLQTCPYVRVIATHKNWWEPTAVNIL